MTKTPTLIILVLLIVTASVSIPALHKYETAKVKTVAKTVDYQSLYTTANKQVQLLTTTAGKLQAQVTELTSQKGQLCTDLSKTRVTDSLCN